MNFAQEASKAYKYALERGPSDKTREIACKDPYYAYEYATKIDNSRPTNETRSSVCAFNYSSRGLDNIYKYAKYIDKGPHEDTRKAACGDPEWAYRYAEDIDKEFRMDTWLAVKDSKYEEKYKEFFNNLMKEEII